MIKKILFFCNVYKEIKLISLIRIRCTHNFITIYINGNISYDYRNIDLFIYINNSKSLKVTFK